MLRLLAGLFFTLYAVPALYSMDINSATINIFIHDRGYILLGIFILISLSIWRIDYSIIKAEKALQ